MNTKRPFHETIVEILDQLPHDTENYVIGILLQLIMKTSIPENHDAIDEALRKLGMKAGIWHERMSHELVLGDPPLNRNVLRVDLREVIESVRDQKALLSVATVREVPALFRSGDTE